MGLRVCMGGWMPFVGMVFAVLAQVTNLFLSKAAISRGMSSLIFVVYANALAAVLFLPVVFLFYRSEHPPVTFSILSRLFLLAFIGSFGQVAGYTAVSYASPDLGTALQNLVPAFTFILAVIFRMETIEWRSSSTLAKSIGALVSITGAFILTFYKGPQLISASLNQFHLLLSAQQNWILGGFLFTCDALSVSTWLVLQASILESFPAEMIAVFYNCVFVSIQCTVVSLIVEKPSSWYSISSMGPIAVLYGGLIGLVFQFSVISWCLRKTGPLYVAMFKPIGIVFAFILGVLFLGEKLYLGSVLGALIIVIGFYAVMWGKAKEEQTTNDSTIENLESSNTNAPLLQNEVGDENMHA